MADEKKSAGVWMSNGNEFALVDDVDTWTPRGWAQADEPTDDNAFVWMEHSDPGVLDPARIPWGARDYWQGIGFAPSAPPDPVDLTRDPHLRDQAAKVEKKPAEKSAEKTTDKPAKAADTQGK